MSERFDVRRWAVAAAAFLAAASIGVFGGVFAGERGCCRTDPEPVVPGGIDAGPGDREIALRLDAAVQAEEARVRALEAAHARELAELGESERRAYEQARARGRAELALWFKERNRRLLLRDAGRPALW